MHKHVSHLTKILLLTVPLIAYADSNAVTNATTTVENTAKTSSRYATDTVITAQVKAKLLAEDDMPSTKISVSTKDGIVSLSGKVDTQLQASKAVSIAQSVHGVNNVNADQLNITDSTSFLQDAFITAKVEGKIAQLSVDRKINSKHDLHVETTNGVVHINGIIGKFDDARVVSDAVKNLDGVQDVKLDVQVTK